MKDKTFRWQLEEAFTLVELLTVMAIIAILAALILSVAGYANKQAAKSRALSEINGLSNACEAYKADNGTYPRQLLAVTGVIPPLTTGTAPSDVLDPRVTSDPSSPLYKNASLALYEALTGDLTATGVTPAGSKNYFQNIKKDMLGRNDMSSPPSAGNPVQFLSDPFGNSYGYSTALNAAQANATPGTAVPVVGYNPTFDLWSTAAASTTTPPAPGTATDVTLQWVKNW